MIDLTDRFTPKQIEDYLGISKVQLHHWERLLGIKPIQRSRGRGASTIYSRENLFLFLLCQRLYQELGFNLQTATTAVRELSKHPKLEDLMFLPALTFGVAKTVKGKPPRNALVKLKGTAGSYLVFKLGDQTLDDCVIARVTIHLEDIGMKAYAVTLD